MFMVFIRLFVKQLLSFMYLILLFFCLFKLFCLIFVFEKSIVIFLLTYSVLINLNVIL